MNTPKLTICVPAPGSPLARHLAQGSAIVTAAQPAEDGRIDAEEAMIWFEGNTHGSENLAAFCQKLANAAGRMMTSYPTIARRQVSRDELIVVGSYDYEWKTIEIERPDLVKAWEDGTGVFDGELEDPATVRLTVDFDFELYGTRVEDLKAAIQAAIEREIANGAITDGTDAEMDSHRITVR